MAELMFMFTLKMFPKNYRGDIAHRLSHSEFKCRCNIKQCDTTLLSDSLALAWEKVRKNFGKPLNVTSGYRCKNHNISVGGVSDSNHTKGQAIDVSTVNLSLEDKIYLVGLMESHFNYVKEYKDFIHGQVNN